MFYFVLMFARNFPPVLQTSEFWVTQMAVQRIVRLFVTVNNVTQLYVTQHNIFRTHFKKHIWLRPGAYGNVNCAFGPARSSSIVSGPRLDSKALCQQLRVVQG